MPTETPIKLKTKKVPKLRFPGFFDAWEEKKLGEVAKFWNGKAHEQDISEDGKYIVVNSKFISQNGDIKKYSNKQISSLKKDDVVIVMSDIPNGKAIGKCFLIDKDETYTLNQRIGGIKSKEIVSSFLFRIINRNKYFLKFDNGVSQTNLRKDEILRCPVVFPSLIEQQKIAEFLGVVDEWIENLKNQKENFEAYKKGMMQKIFSQEIRFKDDNGKAFPKWEEKKLRQLVLVPVSDGPHLTPKFLESGVPFLSVDNLANNNINLDHLRYISKEDHIEFSKKCKPQKGDLLLGKAASVGQVAVANLGVEFNVWSPIAVIRFKKDYDVSFIYFSFQTRFVKKQIRKFINTSSQENLGMGDINKIIFSMPVYPEQRRIAEFLISIDKIIESKQQQITQAEAWKRGLMQGLFV